MRNEPASSRRSGGTVGTESLWAAGGGRGPPAPCPPANERALCVLSRSSGRQVAPYNARRMGKVVKLDAAVDRPGTASRTTQGRRRRTRSKTALVLGGGGFTGGVYEIGALRAFDLLSVNWTVNEFDVYVGTKIGRAHV